MLPVRDTYNGIEIVADLDIEIAIVSEIVIEIVIEFEIVIGLCVIDYSSNPQNWSKTLKNSQKPSKVRKTQKTRKNPNLDPKTPISDAPPPKSRFF